MALRIEVVEAVHGRCQATGSLPIFQLALLAAGRGVVFFCHIALIGYIRRRPAIHLRTACPRKSIIALAVSSTESVPVFNSISSPVATPLLKASRSPFLYLSHLWGFRSFLEGSGRLCNRCRMTEVSAVRCTVPNFIAFCFIQHSPPPSSKTPAPLRSSPPALSPSGLLKTAYAGRPLLKGLVFC